MGHCYPQLLLHPYSERFPPDACLSVCLPVSLSVCMEIAARLRNQLCSSHIIHDLTKIHIEQVSERHVESVTIDAISSEEPVQDCIQTFISVSASFTRKPIPHSTKHLRRTTTLKETCLKYTSCFIELN